jgi:hypothetical protein
LQRFISYIGDILELLMKCAFIPLIFFSLNNATGQSPAPDSATRQTTVARTVSRYHEFMGGQALIYNGAAFIKYDPSIIGHAFFEKDSLRDGSVLFDGVWYRHMPMLYDIVADKLIIADGYRNYLCPVPEKVEQFLLGGHAFIQTSKGYYDVLCSGVLGIQAKRFKQIEEHTSIQEYTRTAYEKDRFYMVKGDVYHPLGNARSLLALLGDKRNMVRQYLRKNKISLRKDKELAMVKAAEYYNQLSR